MYLCARLNQALFSFMKALMDYPPLNSHVLSEAKVSCEIRNTHWPQRLSAAMHRVRRKVVEGQSPTCARTGWSSAPLRRRTAACTPDWPPRAIPSNKFF
jgi:hypothetical protein